MSKQSVRLSCPYCGNEFVQYFDVDKRGPTPVLCDTDDTQGCDQWFVVRVEMVPHVEYAELAWEA